MGAIRSLQLRDFLAHHVLMGMIHPPKSNIDYTKKFAILKKELYIHFSKAHRLLGYPCRCYFSWGVMG